MPTGEPEKPTNVKIIKINHVPEITMKVSLKEALEILKERTFHLPDQHTFNLVDKISEYIYPTEVDH